MAIADEGLEAIATWCDSQMPTHLRDRVRMSTQPRIGTWTSSNRAR